MFFLTYFPAHFPMCFLLSRSLNFSSAVAPRALWDFSNTPMLATLRLSMTLVRVKKIPLHYEMLWLHRSCHVPLFIVLRFPRLWANGYPEFSHFFVTLPLSPYLIATVVFSCPPTAAIHHFMPHVPVSEKTFRSYFCAHDDYFHYLIIVPCIDRF